jgi:hypothetical protein
MIFQRIKIKAKLNSPKMRNLFLNCSLLILLIGQASGFGETSCRTNDVNPLSLLEPSVGVKANFYSGDEDEDASPIAETDFYLLDKSLVNILKDSGFEPEFEDGKQHRLEAEDYLTATRRAFFSEDAESEVIAFLIRDRISKHKLLALKTDHSGQANVKAVKTGNYYLFGVSESGGEVFVWHLPIEIKLGENMIEIDQYNAEVVFSADE